MSAGWLQGLNARYTQLSHRDRLILRWCASAFLLWLIWAVALKPAWVTLRTAPQQQAQLSPQLQTMRAMAVQANALRQSSSAPTPSRQETLNALQNASKRWLGSSAQFTAGTDRVLVTLQAAPAQGLAQWLQDARLNARVVPGEIKLQRANPTGPATWNGTLVLTGPGLETR